MSETGKPQTIGLAMTTAIVVGTVIGSGIFLLPASLAPLGSNAAIGWAISGAGALCVAFALSRIVRPSGNGIQGYIEDELGSTAGFIVAFALLVSAWGAVAATAIAAGAAISRVVPSLSDPWSVAMVAIATTLAITAVNLRGVKAAGGFAILTVAVRIIPLLAVVAVLLLRQSRHEPVAPLAPSPITIDNVATAVTLTLFAIIGFEVGTAPVGKVRNPTRTIPIALMSGTAFCILLYVFSSTAVTLILSPEATAQSLAPYADALKADWGETAARLAATGITVAAIGGLNSNLLCAGEVGFSLGLRRDLPPQMARATKANTPYVSLLVASVIAIILILSNTSKSTAELFIFVSLLTTSATLVLYLFGAIAALRTGVSGLARAAVAVSILFSLFAFYGAGLEADLWCLVLILGGLIIRFVMHRLNARAEAQVGQST